MGFLGALKGIGGAIAGGAGQAAGALGKGAGMLGPSVGLGAGGAPGTTGINGPIGKPGGLINKLSTKKFGKGRSMAGGKR